MAKVDDRVKHATSVARRAVQEHLLKEAEHRMRCHLMMARDKGRESPMDPSTPEGADDICEKLREIVLSSLHVSEVVRLCLGSDEIDQAVASEVRS